MRSKQGFLAELCISFVYYVKSTLDQAKSGLSTLGASSPSDVLSLAPDLTLCSLTFSNAEYLPVLTQLFWCKKLQVNVSTKQVSYWFPLLPTSLRGQWEQSNVSGPALPHGILKWSSIIIKWVAQTERLRTWKELLFPIQLSKEAKGQGLSHYLFQPIFPSLLEAQTKVAHAEPCRWISNQARSCTYLALQCSC